MSICDLQPALEDADASDSPTQELYVDELSVDPLDPFWDPPVAPASRLPVIGLRARQPRHGPRVLAACGVALLLVVVIARAVSGAGPVHSVRRRARVRPHTDTRHRVEPHLARRDAGLTHIPARRRPRRPYVAAATSMPVPAQTAPVVGSPPASSVPVDHSAHVPPAEREFGFER